MTDVEETFGAPSAVMTTPRIPQQRGEPPAGHAVRYAEERRWDVFPGTWLETVGGVPRCSCKDTACEAPGAHPADRHWAGEATCSATTARRLWTREPRASVLLPTGRSFDAIDVPETAGCLALARMERMELCCGPVAGTPEGRMLFFVRQGAAARTPELVRKLGWAPGALDLSTRGEGSWIAAPPTRVGTRGSVQWVCPPTAVNHRLPAAEEIISPLAYACGREASSASSRTG